MAKNHLHLSPRLAWRLSPILVVLFFISIGTISGFTLVGIPLLLNSSADPLPANGVDLDSGPSGTTFTFRVAYFDTSASNLAPTTAELHIDLDGNGIVGGLVTPFYKPPRNSTFWSWAWVSGLLALWLMAMLLARYKKALRPVYAHLALVMSLALFLLVLGCGGGGGGGGEANASHGGLALATCSGLPSEIIPMPIPAVPYNVPVDFSVDVTLDCTPGTVLFRYFFEYPALGEIIVGTRVNLHTLTITP